MKHIKKVILATIVLSLAIGILGLGALAVNEVSAGEREEIESGDWYYRILEDGTAELTAYYGEKVDVVIPAEVDGKKVSKLGVLLFFECASLESVVIPEGLTEIGDYTFVGCTSLESVNIPDSIIKIGDYVFVESSIKKITGGNGLQEIGDSAFMCTDWIRNQNKVKKDGEWYCSLGDIQIKCSRWGDFTKEISFEPERTDWSNYTRAYVELPDGTIMLYNGKVYDLSPINGKKISHILDGAFVFWDGQTVEVAKKTEKDMVIPEGVEYIGGHIGGGIEDYINSIVFPSSLKCIEDWAYVSEGKVGSMGGSITSVTLNEGLIKIGKYAFWGQELKSIIIPSSVKDIGKFAFGYKGYIDSSLYDADAESKNFEKFPDFTIYGYPGTAAEAYAKENGFKFISLENEKMDSLITISSSGDFSPKLEMSKDELLFAVTKYFSEEQLSSVKAGKTPLDFKLTVASIDDSVSEADKELIAQTIKRLPDSDRLNYKVLKYLDIKLSAVIENKELTVPETDGDITLSVALEKPVNENYKIVRIHDGKAEIINARLDNDGTSLTFRTDKFSTYAVIYSDLASGGDAPKTLIAAFMFAGAAAMAAGIAVMIKAFRASEG